MNPTWEFLAMLLNIEKESLKKDMNIVKWDPPGYRFYPDDHEIIIDYLVKEILGFHIPGIKETDDSVFKFDAQYLFEEFKLSEVRNQDGYWNMVREHEEIEYFGYAVGCKNVYLFYRGKPLSDIETEWVMHEYKFNPAIIPPQFLPQHIKHKMDSYVMCKVGTDQKPDALLNETNDSSKNPRRDCSGDETEPMDVASGGEST